MKLFIPFFFLIYFTGIFSYILNNKHFLLMLLSLEFMMLGVFMIMFTNFNFNCTNLFFLMIFLTMAVCEGVLGLSMMVLMIRVSGNDYVMSMSFLW